MRRLWKQLWIKLNHFRNYSLYLQILCVRRPVGSFSPSLHLPVQYVPEHWPTSETASLKINVKWTDFWCSVIKERNRCRQCSSYQFWLWVSLRRNRYFTKRLTLVGIGSVLHESGGGMLHPSISCCVGDNITLIGIKTVFKKNTRKGWVRTEVLNTACLRKALKNKVIVARSTLCKS